MHYIYADQSDLGKNDLYKEIFYILTTAFATFIPLILLTTFNCFLVATVHRSHKIRHKMTNTRQVYKTLLIAILFASWPAIRTAARIIASSSSLSASSEFYRFIVMICISHSVSRVAVNTFPSDGTYYWYLFSSLVRFRGGGLAASQY